MPFNQRFHYITFREISAANAWYVHKQRIIYYKLEIFCLRGTVYHVKKYIGPLKSSAAEPALQYLTKCEMISKMT